MSTFCWKCNWYWYCIAKWKTLENMVT